MNKTPDAPVKFSCEFCNRSFMKEITVLRHICEYKHRWLEKDKQGNRIGFQTWLQFYTKNSTSKKNRTYQEFIKSAYYTAFAKFGTHCVNIGALNVSRFTDWLLREQIKIDQWCHDSIYNKYLIDYLKVENPLDAIARSIETTITLAPEENLRPGDYLRYTHPNKVCYQITLGKVSPWMLYQSESGTTFLSTLNTDHVKIINDYINPEQWAIKFKRDPESAKQVKELLKQAGY